MSDDGFQCSRQRIVVARDPRVIGHGECRAQIALDFHPLTECLLGQRDLRAGSWHRTGVMGLPEQFQCFGIAMLAPQLESLLDQRLVARLGASARGESKVTTTIKRREDPITA